MIATLTAGLSLLLEIGSMPLDMQIGNAQVRLAWLFAENNDVLVRNRTKLDILQITSILGFLRGRPWLCGGYDILNYLESPCFIGSRQFRMKRQGHLLLPKLGSLGSSICRWAYTPNIPQNLNLPRAIPQAHRIYNSADEPILHELAST